MSSASRPPPPNNTFLATSLRLPAFHAVAARLGRPGLPDGTAWLTDQATQHIIGFDLCHALLISIEAVNVPTMEGNCSITHGRQKPDALRLSGLHKTVPAVVSGLLAGRIRR